MGLGLKAGAVWDFDGVIVETPHEEAWRRACRLLGIKGFTRELYESRVSGRTRIEGAREIVKALAGAGGSEGAMLALELARLKNSVYRSLVEAGFYRLRADAVEFIRAMRGLGIVQVLASASKNASSMARGILLGDGSRLIDLFHFDVSGIGESKEEVLIEASRLLDALGGQRPCKLLFEDSPSGVRIGVRLGYKVIGVSRESLLDYGASYVVKSFSRVDALEVVKAVGCPA